MRGTDPRPGTRATEVLLCDTGILLAAGNVEEHVRQACLRLLRHTAGRAGSSVHQDSAGLASGKAGDWAVDPPENARSVPVLALSGSVGERLTRWSNSRNSSGTERSMSGTAVHYRPARVRRRLIGRGGCALRDRLRRSRLADLGPVCRKALGQSTAVTRRRRQAGGPTRYARAALFLRDILMCVHYGCCRSAIDHVS
jgi:hypothetical protein